VGDLSISFSRNESHFSHQPCRTICQCEENLSLNN